VGPMNGENQSLVKDEVVEFDKKTQLKLQTSGKLPIL
jgi:hypothetical protein